MAFFSLILACTAVAEFGLNLLFLRYAEDLEAALTVETIVAIFGTVIVAWLRRRRNIIPDWVLAFPVGLLVGNMLTWALVFWALSQLRC